ncbi:hypothetical protein BJF78_25360 [Pseudonocardia sp. CNS-139]|nr:hypothetical protein BJF78_25360 [Pseudonocardia sp. CNS-139]
MPRRRDGCLRAGAGHRAGRRLGSPRGRGRARRPLLLGRRRGRVRARAVAAGHLATGSWAWPTVGSRSSAVGASAPAGTAGVDGGGTGCAAGSGVPFADPFATPLAVPLPTVPVPGAAGSSGTAAGAGAAACPPVATGTRPSGSSGVLVVSFTR